MSDRQFRFVLGILLLIGLYFDLRTLLLGLIGFQFIEGITNWRLSVLLRRVAGIPPMAAAVTDIGLIETKRDGLIPFDAERAWRLLMAAALVVSYVVIPDPLWWVPWFIGFATLGAGLSGVCPTMIMLRLLGFR